ncbi:BglG family transcription antiterminator [Virgibacillus salidurans]|uniref:BglG family transcription antiterminator n=1 Tax=Virgibacillus salidurans TaxID=2831673 RepID=UPI001F35BE19|nr:BglG family transcription antiterminator [Virgibacillus sp. NKC19-16]
MSRLYIAGRQRKVIELLLNHSEGITVKEMANKLGASSRTIHRDLKNSEKVLFDHNLILAKKTGVGVRVTGSEQDTNQLKLALSSTASSDFTPDERRAVILSTLLEANEPIKLFALTQDLHVTVATISHDLDSLEEALLSYNLSLIRRRGYGVKIEGDEKDKRAAISNLITQYMDPFEFVSVLKENIQKKSQLNTISNRLLGLVNPEKLSLIESRVEQTRDELPYTLADSAHIGLVVHLALAIERLQKGDTITIDPAYLQQIEGTKEYAIAKKLIRDLEISFDMEIPDDEIGYITMHLMGAKLRRDPSYLMEDSSINIAHKAKELIQFVSIKLDIDLTANSALLNDLVTHLKPTIYRMKQGMNINNPMIDEITRDYGDLFQLITQGAEEIFPDAPFPKDEIGYLVLHFASALLQDEKEVAVQALVICSSGIGTAKILATKLMQHVPEIKRVENKSLFDLDRSQIKAYDLIVSTIPLKGFEGDYILASPMLTQAEVHRIKKAIRQKTLTRRAAPKRVEKISTDTVLQIEAMHNYSKVILELLHAFYVSEIAKKRTIEEILQSICIELEKSRMIDDKGAVLEKLLKREKASGLGIPGTTLALYHTRSGDVNAPNFTIYSLNHPIMIKGMDGDTMKMERMLLMLSPEDTHQEVLEILSYVSSLIIQSQESMTLFQSGDEAQIRKFLTKEFQAFLKDVL